jgi:DNA-binding transcriptional LysR family regulator
LAKAAEKGKGAGLAAFRAEPFVAYGRRWAPEFYDAWVTICQRAGFTPNVVQETAEMDTMLALVSAGVGVAILPEGLARRRARELKIRALPADAAWSQMGIAVRDSHGNPLLTNLIALAVDVGRKASRADYGKKKR